MSTITTGREFKAFFADSVFWPEGGDTYVDDMLLTVDGCAFTSEQDPMDLADAALVELTCGWVIEIPSDIAGGKSDMALDDYFQHWQKRQTTTTLAVECPLALREQVIAAIKQAGGTVQGE